MKKIVMAACAAVVGLMALGPVMAEDTPTVARMWKFTAKDGMQQQLEAAVKAHAEFREANGDPWSWNLYQVQTGELDGAWFARSPNHTWADIDAYGNSEFLEKATAHWNETVAPYVASVSTEFAQYLPEISNWPEGAVYAFYWVYRYDVKAGQGRQFEAAAKAITDVLKEIGWDDTWAFTRHLTGDASAFSLVLPEGDWAGFAGPESTAFEAVAEARGQEAAQAMWVAFGATLAGIQSTIYVRSAEMSVVGASE